MKDHHLEWRRVVIKGTVLPFEVSYDGVVRRIPGPDAIGRVRKAKIATPHLVGGCRGYLQVILKHDFKTYSPLVHTLVAFAFLEPPPGEYGRGKIGVNHINGVKTDNRASNLEWVTPQQNSTHASLNGLMLIGEDNPAAVLTAAQVKRIRLLYGDGTKKAELARMFRCSYYAIDAVCQRWTWKHI